MNKTVDLIKDPPTLQEIEILKQHLSKIKGKQAELIGEPSKVRLEEQLMEARQTILQVIDQNLLLEEEIEALKHSRDSLKKKLRHEETERMQLLSDLKALQHSKSSDGDLQQEIQKNKKLEKSLENLTDDYEALKLNFDYLKDNQSKIEGTVSQFANIIYSKASLSNLDNDMKQLMKEVLHENHAKSMSSYEAKIRQLLEDNKNLRRELSALARNSHHSISQIKVLKENIKNKVHTKAIKNELIRIIEESQNTLQDALNESEAAISLSARISIVDKEDAPFGRRSVNDDLVWNLKKKNKVLEEQIKKNQLESIEEEFEEERWDSKCLISFLQCQAIAVESLFTNS